MSDDLEELRARVAALEAKLSGATMVEHLVAGRVDVVEQDGKLRVSISNAKQSADAVIDGHVLAQGRERPGILFFNEHGDECGGISYGGRRTAEGGTEAGAIITMDRFSNDQIVALFYQETAEGHSAGLQVVDRPDIPLPSAIKRARELEAMPEGPERDKASEDFYADYPFGSMRLRVGLFANGDAGLEVCDAGSRPRLRLSVADEGAVSISILDESGAVVREL